MPRTKKDAPAPRGAGRPVDSQSVGRDRIIDCTVDLLGRRTPEELTILEIAAEAGVNRALVRYYFGDLRGLLHEVTEFLMRQLQDRMERALRQPGSLREQLKARLTLRLEFMRQHPHFERLALAEIYHAPRTGNEAGAPTPIQRVTARGLEITAMLFPEGVPPAVDPRFVHLILIGVPAFVSTAQPLIETLFGTGPQAETMMDAYVDFVARMLEDQIRPDGGGRLPSPT
ncbi:TetR/AcrR family transcriptional regulator [Pigmentiphaga sp. GD03639]|jgi:AcrR family transcriptional regulator|uniref:HTH tetR-type domain-containing protein n=1 Tax=Pigmentiphaga daeguensis TaxID=414049 RepID=A0ABN1BMQ9_9BURK|nr:MULTISPECIES: TetR/AcrR family transcriptional regulator [unclassified Pigmentiphaga]MDH2235204.1 TetR/AcrR family transcriptional regulator [Pigmentiphaga sp. GD03639]